MESKTLQSEKNKVTMSIIFGLVIIGAAFFIGLTILLAGDFDLQQIKSPITYIILGVFVLIALSHIINKLLRYRRLLKLLPAMEMVAKSLEMQYLSEESALSAPDERNFLRPIVGKLRGIKPGREVTIYPAFDYTRVKNNAARSVTVFQMPLGHEAAEISIEPKGILADAISKMMGGSIEFREKYYILTQFIGNIDERSKIKILEDTKKIFPPEAMTIYESIPGKHTLLIKNNTVIFGMDGFHYDLETYKKGLDFITRVNGALVKTL